MTVNELFRSLTVCIYQFNYNICICFQTLAVNIFNMGCYFIIYLWLISDFAWSVIQEFASELEAEPIPGRPRIPSTPQGRRLTRQFSFTRSVSKDVYKRSLSRSSLYDGATPIVVHDDEDTNVFDECFQNALPIKEEWPLIRRYFSNWHQMTK